MTRTLPCIGLSAALLAPAGTFAQEAPDTGTRFAVEAFVGTAANVPSTLRLRQDGEADLDLDARFDTRPMSVPIYWNVRLSLLAPVRAIELQFTHHKLFLSNPPPEVRDFEITHGFNLFTLAYAWRQLPVDLRLGGGVVIPHASGTVRGQGYSAPSGGFLGREWHRVGPALLAGVGKRWEPVRHLLLVVDGELTAAWARDVPVTGGAYDVDNLAFHLRLGLGYAF